MTTIVYTLGNGYRCHCCQQTWREEEDFDDGAAEEEIIATMAKIGVGVDDWLGIHRIYGYNGDADALDAKIKLAIKHETSIGDLVKKMKDAEASIRKINSWFDNLETEKAKQAKERTELKATLAELKQQFNELTTTR